MISDNSMAGGLSFFLVVIKNSVSMTKMSASLHMSVTNLSMRIKFALTNNTKDWDMLFLLLMILTGILIKTAIILGALAATKIDQQLAQEKVESEVLKIKSIPTQS